MERKQEENKWNDRRWDVRTGVTSCISHHPNNRQQTRLTTRRIYLNVTVTFGHESLAMIPVGLVSFLRRLNIQFYFVVAFFSQRQVWDESMQTDVGFVRCSRISSI